MTGQVVSGAVASTGSLSYSLFMYDERQPYLAVALLRLGHAIICPATRLLAHTNPTSLLPQADTRKRQSPLR